MTKGQITLLSTGIFLIFALYFFGDTTPPEKIRTGGAEEEETEFDIITYRTEATEKLSPNVQKVIAEFDSVKALNNNEVALKSSFVKVVNVLSENSQYPLAAMYTAELATTYPSDSSWDLAGDNYTRAYISSGNNMPLRSFLVEGSIVAYEKALELKPESIPVEVKLASTYMDNEVDIMKGVTLLKGVTEREPNNTTANLILGRYGIVSGQYKKAVQRLETVIKTDSTNAEAYYFMAEAYNGLGDKKKAIELFEKCKTLLNNPQFSSDIDKYIESIKNS